MKLSPSQFASNRRLTGSQLLPFILRVFLGCFAAGGCWPMVHAADVSYYGVIKSQRYVQTVSTGPTALLQQRFWF